MIRLISVHGEDNRLALHLAARDGLTSVLPMVFTNEIVNAQDRFGQTALHLAVSNNRDECVQFLLENGADTSLTDRKGRTPLQIAEECGYQSLLDLLKTD